MLPIVNSQELRIGFEYLSIGTAVINGLNHRIKEALAQKNSSKTLELAKELEHVFNMLSSLEAQLDTTLNTENYDYSKALVPYTGPTTSLDQTNIINHNQSSWYDSMSQVLTDCCTKENLVVLAGVALAGTINYYNYFADSYDG